jgi:acetoin:2,6-dichlorophenolindophenol oxidoreductase subunit alpha
LTIDRDTLLGLYVTMVRIRRFEERVASEFYAGNVPGYVHSYIGQEAVASGVCAHMSPQDRITSNHRGHGHCVAKGAGMKRMMAEIYGKATGYCKGKGGSMHIADFSVGMLGADGIVAAGLPIATGAALAAKLEGKGNVVAVFFGDGACAEGELHECLNLAAIWELPLLFVCENNHWAINIPVRHSVAASEITRMPEAYHIPSRSVDGNDVEAVYEAAGEAIRALRTGRGPRFLECHTYRWHKHFLSDNLQDWRPEEELVAWKDRCPLLAFEVKWLAAGMLTTADVECIDAEVMAEVEEAHRFALDSPYPDPQDAHADVYSL